MGCDDYARRPGLSGNCPYVQGHCESDIGPKLNKLAEGQQVLLETLAPKNRVEELEDEVSFLKSLIRMHSEQIAELKKKIGA